MPDQPKNEEAQEQPEKKKRQQKPKGRGSDEGSVFKRKTDNRNKPRVAQITLENRKKTVIGCYKTEAEAISAKNKALRDLEQGAWVANSRQTLEEYLDYWLEHVHKSTLEITTYANYRSALNNHLIPGLGHIHVQKLTMYQVQVFYSKLINEKELGAGRVRFLHALLHCALEHAVKENLIARNVCDGVMLPRKKQRDQRVFTPDEARQLLLSIQKSEMRMLILLAIVTGMRCGELLASH